MGYGQDIVSWEHAMGRATAVRDELQRRMPEVIIDVAYHPADEVGEAAIGLSVYHMSATKMEDSDEAFFNCVTHTFVFWRWGVWMLQTNDVVGSSGHFHRRVMTRDASLSFSFTGLHDAVSELWPALVELGQRRRLNRASASLTFFVVPYADGLICAEFQKLRESGRFRPVIKVLDKEIVTDYTLSADFSNGDDRVLVMPKTYLNRRRLNSNQKILHQMLKDYLAKHRDAIDYLRRASRLHYASAKVGLYMKRTFNDDRFPQSRLDAAMSDLHGLTTSLVWVKESERNRRAADRSLAGPVQAK